MALERIGNLHCAKSLYLAVAALLPVDSVHCYYQALALRKLGCEDNARAVLEAFARMHTAPAR